MKAKRRMLTHDEIITKSLAIYNRLVPYLENAGTVMCYLAAFNEPRTDQITEYLFGRGKQVAVPITGARTITPALLTPHDKLRTGAYGIREPEKYKEVNISDIDIALIPGIAFDTRGMRIGFGKGYYDRFLESFKGVKIGICYEFQVFSALNCDSHDVPMDMLVTERRIYDF